MTDNILKEEKNMCLVRTLTVCYVTYVEKVVLAVSLGKWGQKTKTLIVNI